MPIVNRVRLTLAVAWLLTGCSRHHALTPCPPPIPPEPRPLILTHLSREADPALASVRAGGLVVIVYAPEGARRGLEQLQAPAQVSLTAHFAEGFLAHVWRAATDSLTAARLDTVLAGQYVLAVDAEGHKPHRQVVHIRPGFVDTVRVEYLPRPPIVISCPPL